jgi:arabinoxylan arabinofuranohydrolase
MNIRSILTALILLVSFAVNTTKVFADEVIVGYRHLADPASLVYNGRVYLYASNDDDNTKEKNSGYIMKSIVCVSSSDMKNWTDHGVVFEVPRDASWAKRTWAPSVIARNGKIFMYFGNGDLGIGVVSSTNPIGPFKDPIGKELISTQTPGVLPVQNMWLFDPMTFIDENGQAYMYFGGNGESNIRVIKLNQDMISVNGPAITLTAPSYFEASWLHKRNGIYYFSYSSNPKAQMRIDYMTSKQPTSGFTYAGVIAAQPANNNNNNHQAIFEFKGQWYHAFHNRKIAYQMGIPTEFKRNLGIEQLNHNPDGTIEQIVYTANGVKQIEDLNPFNRVEAETMSAQKGVKTELCRNGGMNVTGLIDGDWIMISGVDFGSQTAKKFIANLIGNGATIELRLGSQTGKLIGTLNTSIAKNTENFKSISCEVAQVTGKHDLFLVIKGSGTNPLKMDWWQFTTK